MIKRGGVGSKSNSGNGWIHEVGRRDYLLADKMDPGFRMRKKPGKQTLGRYLTR